MKAIPLHARRVACTLAAWSALGAVHAQEPARDAAMPYYTAAETLQSLYGRHLPARAESFAQAARAQEQALSRFCAEPNASPNAGDEGLRTQWRQTHTAWLQLATPSVGPLVVRRSLRQIDFTPIRPQLIERAIKKAPTTAADMELVGTPAKGFGALDWLLAQGLRPSTAECAYAIQVARAITMEADHLVVDFKALQSRTWTSESDGDEAETSEAGDHTAEATGAAMAEWVNQWLGGLERLRWAQMEKPIKAVEGSDKPPAFARLALADNLLEWQTQWQALQAQALLTPAQRQAPPVPGTDLISIEALLLTKGHIELSLRWRGALGDVDALMRDLPRLAAQGETSQDASPAQPGREAILALAARLKAVTALYQTEVAPALDIPLGFSDSDGD